MLMIYNSHDIFKTIVFFIIGQWTFDWQNMKNYTKSWPLSSLVCWINCIEFHSKSIHCTKYSGLIVFRLLVFTASMLSVTLTFTGYTYPISGIGRTRNNATTFA